MKRIFLRDYLEDQVTKRIAIFSVSLRKKLCWWLIVGEVVNRVYISWWSSEQSWHAIISYDVA